MPDLQAVIRLIESKKKSNVSWERLEPCPQPYFGYDEDSRSWQEANSSKPTNPITTFEVLSWNIDFMLPFINERMQVALDHLYSLISASSIPCIIFLNECLVSDLYLMQSQTWIQQGYYTTDLDDQYWESGHYGTCTLIPKSMSVKNVFRVHYEATRMERDVLCVDIDPGNGTDKVLRICNSHLESLVADPPLRPKQVEAAAKYMHAPEVYGAIIGGDFNAIQPFDRTLHSDNGLKDAYLEMGGKEDDDSGYTWGQMAPVKQREMFGCSRMDKLFYCGGVEVEGFERFGLGVRVGNKEIERALMKEEGMDGGWVTDHAGVRGVFRVMDGESDGKIPGAKI